MKRFGVSTTAAAAVAATLCCLLAGLPARAEAGEQPAPSYPLQARAYGVDASVVVLLRVDETGRVSQVKLEEITAPGWGFEEVVRNTVKQWRFEPARVEGRAVPRVYRRTLTFEAERARDLARMYPVRSSRAFEAAGELLAELELEAKTVLAGDQVIMTADLPLTDMPEGFPQVRDLGTAQWRFVQIHLFVSPWVEPARVYCNARLARFAGDYVSAALYSEGTVEGWLLDRLDEKLGHFGRAVPMNPTRREQLAIELAEGLSVEADRPVARVIVPDDPDRNEMKPPLPIGPTRVPAIDPTEPRPREDVHVVQLEAVVHEDGSVAVASVLSSPEGGSRQLVAAAVQAARLWRFRPARLEGRPVGASTNLTVQFPKRRP
jgi:TonB family protein